MVSIICTGNPYQIKIQALQVDPAVTFGPEFNAAMQHDLVNKGLPCIGGKCICIITRADQVIQGLCSSTVFSAPGLLRLSIGIEDVDDIWEDLDRAIAAAMTS